MTFEPQFQITPTLTKVLMDLEASRQAISVPANHSSSIGIFA